MNKVHLIMPMGGAGTRFFNDGYILPKPLILIHDKPFFYWATKSIIDFIDVSDITFVILQEHIDKFNIDKEIKRFFKDAKLVVLDRVLDGAVLTCIEGVKNIVDDNPIIFNDCDHLFRCKEFYDYCNKGKFDISGGLLTFESNSNNYSYVKFDQNYNVIGTKEKEVISNSAICGVYYFENKETFLNCSRKYLLNCEYKEFFMSGVYNILAEYKRNIRSFQVDFHISFGTPMEYESVLKNKKFEELLK